jgi:hypothetical protein
MVRRCNQCKFFLDPGWWRERPLPHQAIGCGAQLAGMLCELRARGDEDRGRLRVCGETKFFGRGLKFNCGPKDRTGETTAISLGFLD